VEEKINKVVQPKQWFINSLHSVLADSLLNDFWAHFETSESSGTHLCMISRQALKNIAW